MILGAVALLQSCTNIHHHHHFSVLYFPSSPDDTRASLHSLLSPLLSLFKVLGQRAVITQSTDQHLSPHLKALCSSVYVILRQSRVLRYPLCHVILSSSPNQDWSAAALSCGLCLCCVRSGCIKSTLWLCLITDSEEKVRGRLLAERRYHTLPELKQNNWRRLQPPVYLPASLSLVKVSEYIFNQLHRLWYSHVKHFVNSMFIMIS